MRKTGGCGRNVGCVSANLPEKVKPAADFRAEQRRAMLKAAAKMSELTPGMVEKLYGWFVNEDTDEKGRLLVSVNERAAIARLFMDFTKANEQVARELGLTKEKEEGAEKSPLIAVLGGNVTVVRNLSKEDRAALLLGKVQGTKALPASGVTVSDPDA